MSLGLNNNEFLSVSSLVGEPKDYFDFPSSILAFSHSLKGSYLKIHKGCIFRAYGKSLTLIYFKDSENLRLAIRELRKLGFSFKSLNFVKKDLKGLKLRYYGKEFYVYGNWELDLGTGKRRNRLGYILRRGERNYFLENDLNKKELLALFDKWYIKAKERHFMVIKGHYLEYIRQYFIDKNNVFIFGFRDKFSGELYGMVGYEIFGGKAQLTLMKHVLNDNYFSKYFWTKSLKRIQERHNISKIFCGSTADSLKSDLGFNFDKSYKIDLDKI